jgi:hypothetical protein
VEIGTPSAPACVKPAVQASWHETGAWRTGASRVGRVSALLGQRNATVRLEPLPGQARVALNVRRRSAPASSPLRRSVSSEPEALSLRGAAPFLRLRSSCRASG